MTNPASGAAELSHAAELVLGTAQLGIPYGRCNSAGMPSQDAARTILTTAKRLGIRQVDTARLYGESEWRIGDAIEQGALEGVTVLTKLGVPDQVMLTGTDREVELSVSESVLRSCRELGVRSLDVLMLHRWSHRHARGGVVWKRLLELQQEGVIAKLGASVQSPIEAAEAVADPDVLHMQLPSNLLDTRWTAAGIDRQAALRPELTVHARSVFLQGILVSSAERWPDVAGVEPAAMLGLLQQLVVELGRESVADLCVAYVRGLPWVRGLVMGVETEEQLLENARLFSAPALSVCERDAVRALLPEVPEQLLDPAMW